MIIVFRPRGALGQARFARKEVEVKPSPALVEIVLPSVLESLLPVAYAFAASVSTTESSLHPFAVTN
jgi:hypothetical protein